jgi:hypothetical protein
MTRVDRTTAAQNPIDREIIEFADKRDITEVLHFTTNTGLIGMLGRGAVLSRKLLPEDRYLTHVYSPNCEVRKDPAWTNYVNLSISRINGWMFETSTRWHQTDDVWWAILSFESSVLADPGVWFTTTNNIYPARRRGQGAAGLAALFDEEVASRYGTIIRRPADHPAAWPTDRQAEALYPNKLGLDRLQQIYVRDENHIDSVYGMFAGVSSVNPVRILCSPEVFA